MEICLKPKNLVPGTDRVYLDFYNLKEAPFSLTPDPQFLFMAKTHQDAIDKIIYGIYNRMGFIILTGEVGTGKTTLCRYILDQLDDKAKTAYIINPSLSGKEILSCILDDLGIKHNREMSKKEMIACLNDYILLIGNNIPIVIIIDDAQTMSVEALEELRLLSNLETDKVKYIQMILVGQPELLDLISLPEMRQLRQRVAININLGHLTKEEVKQYISRRLYSAGDMGAIRFSPGAINKIYKVNGGIPRLINSICEHILVAGYVSNSFSIGQIEVKKAIDDIKHLDFTLRSSFRSRVEKKMYYVFKWLFYATSIFIFIYIMLEGR